MFFKKKNLLKLGVRNFHVTSICVYNRTMKSSRYLLNNQLKKAAARTPKYQTTLTIVPNTCHVANFNRILTAI